MASIYITSLLIKYNKEGCNKSLLLYWVTKARNYLDNIFLSDELELDNLKRLSFKIKDLRPKF